MGQVFHPSTNMRPLSIDDPIAYQFSEGLLFVLQTFEHFMPVLIPLELKNDACVSLYMKNSKEEAEEHTWIKLCTVCFYLCPRLNSTIA